MTRMLKGQPGFTLIELIVTIIVAALMGTAVFVYMGNVLTRSHEPITQARSLGDAVEVMEGFTAEYQKYLTGQTDWSTFSGAVTGAGVTKVNRKGESGTDFSGVSFDVWEVTVTRGDQTLCGLFTQ